MVQMQNSTATKSGPQRDSKAEMKADEGRNKKAAMRPIQDQGKYESKELKCDKGYN